MSVQDTSEDYTKYKDRWGKCRRFVAGQDAVMEAKEKDLPRIPGQKDAEYKEYLQKGYLYNATGRTVQGLVGMVMRKEPDLNVPSRLEPLTEDMDQEGTTIQEMAEDSVREEITVARGGFLVDFPNVEVEGMSEADAEELNLRPYAVRYKAEDILFVRTARVQNVTKVVHIRLQEADERVAADDEFETEKIKRVRVLDLLDDEEGVRYQQRVFEQQKEGGAYIEDEEQRYVPTINGEVLDEIPFSFIGGYKFREPYIIDLVNANKHHYQLKADHMRGLRWTTRPQHTASGQKGDEVENLVVGGDNIWWSSNPDAKWGMIEYSGTGLSAVEKEMEQTKEEMATLGARMIAPEKRQAETAEAHIIKREGENSALSTVSKHVSVSLTEVLEWFARWTGTDQEVSITLNNDFIAGQMSMDDVKKWTQVHQSGSITDQDYYYVLNQGEVLDPELSYEDRMSQLQTRDPEIDISNSNSFPNGR